MLSEKGRFSIKEKPASSLELETEADDEREMVAEATLIAVAIIGTERLDSSVLFVFFKEEGSVVDIGAIDSSAQSAVNQHMIDALPNAVEIMGTLVIHIRQYLNGVFGFYQCLLDGRFFLFCYGRFVIGLLVLTFVMYYGSHSLGDFRFYFLFNLAQCLRTGEDDPCAFEVE